MWRAPHLKVLFCVFSLVVPSTLEGRNSSAEDIKTYLLGLDRYDGSISEPKTFLKGRMLELWWLLRSAIQNCRLSPISHTSNTPVSGMPLLVRAFLRSWGGSSTSSSVNTQVPQCIPMARLHFVSLKILTLSKGFACIGDIIQRGS